MNPSGAEPMPDRTNPREALKNALHELQDLRGQLKGIEREKQERPAVIGVAGHWSGTNHLAALTDRGALDQVGSAFDHEFFGLDQAAADALAPHLRLLLETGWEALENSGCPPASLSAKRVGVFVGIGGSEPQRDGAPRIRLALQSAQCLARQFALRGPVANIDAGDASALAAVDLACRSLLAREVDIALAGGVGLVDDDAGTAGGCGLVILKRLSDAVAQRDNVLAIVDAHGLAFSSADGATPLASAADPASSATGDVAVGDGAYAGHLDGLSALLDAILAIQAGTDTERAVAAGWENRATLALRTAPPSFETDAPGPYLLLLSARAGPALNDSAGRLADYLRETPTANLANVAYTLRAGRTHFARRRALVVDTREQALAALEQAAGATAPLARTGRSLVFVFPGLGSHYLDMARGLYQAEPVFQAVVDQCARLLQPHLGLDIRTLIFAAGSDSPALARGAGQFNLRQMLRRQDTPADPAAAQLDQTLHAQPALFVVEYALARLLAAWGLRPAAMLGYSLGEYVAACLAGVLTLEDALFLVATRARLIQALPPGKMVAVPLSEAALAPMIGSDLAISAVNSRSLCVVAGEPVSISALVARLAQDGTAAQVLPTTHAFHTARLRPMAAAFKEALGSIKLNAPVVPYVSNLTGDWITAAQATSPDYWVEHSCQPVRFAAGVETLQRAGDDLLVEVGPSQALSSLIAAAARELGDTGLRCVPIMRSEYVSQTDPRVLLMALGELWQAGATVDCESFHPARRVALPTYPFRHPLLATPAEPLPQADHAGSPTTLTESLGTPTEQALAELWCDLLKLRGVDPGRTFFEHGGNSLQAAQLIFRIKKTFGVTLRLRSVYEAPSLPAMAALIDGQTASPTGGAALSQPALTTDGWPITLPNGLDILCRNEHEVRHFYQDIFVDRVYASHGLTLTAGAVVFDVGANIGLFSLFAHLEAAGAQLFSFEPAPPLVGLLKANLARHGVVATVYNCALGSQPGTAVLTFYPKSTGMSSLYANLDEEKAVLETVLRNQVRRGESELEPLLAHADDYLAERFKEERYTCRLRTLSEVIAEAGLERIDLLKIDVQKAELDVLMGLDDSDWPKIRQVVVEVHDVDGRLDRLRQMLAERGFQVESDQEALYAGSPIYLLYGTRDSRA